MYMKFKNKLNYRVKSQGEWSPLCVGIDWGGAWGNILGEEKCSTSGFWKAVS